MLVSEESIPLFRQGIQVYEIKVMCNEVYLAFNSTFFVTLVLLMLFIFTSFCCKTC